MMTGRYRHGPGAIARGHGPDACPRHRPFGAARRKAYSSRRVSGGVRYSGSMRRVRTKPAQGPADAGRGQWRRWGRRRREAAQTMRLAAARERHSGARCRRTTHTRRSRRGAGQRAPGDGHGRACRRGIRPGRRAKAASPRCCSARPSLYSPCSPPFVPFCSPPHGGPCAVGVDKGASGGWRLTIRDKGLAAEISARGENRSTCDRGELQHPGGRL